MVARVSDASAEAYISLFNEHAEKVVGCSADELDQLKSQVNVLVFVLEFLGWIYEPCDNSLLSCFSFKCLFPFLWFQEGEDNQYQLRLKQATWVPYLWRVSVAQNEYNNEKRQRVTARAIAEVDFAVESRYLLEEISKMRGVSQWGRFIRWFRAIGLLVHRCWFLLLGI